MDVILHTFLCILLTFFLHFLSGSLFSCSVMFALKTKAKIYITFMTEVYLSPKEMIYQITSHVCSGTVYSY